MDNEQYNQVCEKPVGERFVYKAVQFTLNGAPYNMTGFTARFSILGASTGNELAYSTNNIANQAQGLFWMLVDSPAALALAVGVYKLRFKVIDPSGNPQSMRAGVLTLF
jgi:hypothetical protein